MTNIMLIKEVLVTDGSLEFGIFIVLKWKKITHRFVCMVCPLSPVSSVSFFDGLLNLKKPRL